jgi:hypothetical protein
MTMISNRAVRFAARVSIMKTGLRAGYLCAHGAVLVWYWWAVTQPEAFHGANKEADILLMYAQLLLSGPACLVIVPIDAVIGTWFPWPQRTVLEYIIGAGAGFAQWFVAAPIVYRFVLRLRS